MRRLTHFLSTAALFALPAVIHAQQGFDGDGGRFGDLLSELLVFTNNVLIPFIIGIGFLVFVFGMFQYFIAGGANEDSREKGKNVMIFATLGFVFIVIFWGIVNLLASSTGFEGDNLDDVPDVELIR
jgi:hypothetical protein